MYMCTILVATYLYYSIIVHSWLCVAMGCNVESTKYLYSVALSEHSVKF